MTIDAIGDIDQAFSRDDFGDMLRRYRGQVGLTQSQLAKTVGVHSSYISRMERGERQAASREMVLRMVDVLRLDGRSANQLLLSAGYAPLPRNDVGSADPTLSLLVDLFHDNRISDADLGPLREYAKLLDRLRRQR